jgi:drug/metabolite transporter (DMT)-like permease
MMKILLLILVAEVWNTAGQIMFKKSANSLEMRSLKGFKTKIAFLKDVFTNPLIWIGFGSMTVSLAIWMVALAGADLSFVFPVGSLQYIFILVAAYIFLGEKIDRMKLAGTLLVVLGIVLIAVS